MHCCIASCPTCSCKLRINLSVAFDKRAHACSCNMRCKRCYHVLTFDDVHFSANGLCCQRVVACVVTLHNGIIKIAADAMVRIVLILHCETCTC
jgi:hypothetical protein